MATREAIYDQAISCIERYAAAEIKSKDETAETVANKLREHMTYYFNSKASYEALEKLHSHSLTEIQNAKSTDEVKKICKEFEKKAKDTKNIDGTANSRYTDFLELLSAHDDEDDDIQMTKASKNVIDPISKQRMVDPVKNTKCGHSYEKNVVLMLLKKNPKTRCPIAGCSATQYIDKKHLVPDHELKRHLLMSFNQSVASEENSRIVCLDETT